MSGYIPFRRRPQVPIVATPATVATRHATPQLNRRNVATVAKGPSFVFGEDGGGFEERAAIAEYDGGLPRGHAEVLAALHFMTPPGHLSDHDVAEMVKAAALFLQDRRLVTH